MIITNPLPTHPLIWDSINPGDSFYWVYWEGALAKKSVTKDELLFSSEENSWVGPIDGMCLLIAKTPTHVRFLNSEGRLIRVLAADTMVPMRNGESPSAVPVLLSVDSLNHT
jgi:hypothetical protein